jgi:type II secretory pathway pseudopilin PulG
MQPIDEMKGRVRRGWRSAAGFTLVDTLLAVTVFGIVSAVAVPSMSGAVDQMRLRIAARDVEQELQSARFLAVSSNRPVRVRFNCPDVGQYRVVELIGSPASPDALDDQLARCGTDTFPYPAGDSDPLTRPNLDGPLRRLPEGVTFVSAQTVEFWPDGTAHASSGGDAPWPKIAADGVAVSITKDSETRAVEVNGRGKIRIR